MLVPMRFVSASDVMHTSKSEEEQRIATEVSGTLPRDVEITLLRRGYSRLTGRGEIHTEVRQWFESYVPQISDSEILEAYSRMLLIDRMPSLAMSRERELLVLRMLFFRAHQLARERGEPTDPESIGKLIGQGYEPAQIREVLFEVFRTSLSIMPVSVSGRL